MSPRDELLNQANNVLFDALTLTVLSVAPACCRWPLPLSGAGSSAASSRRRWRLGPGTTAWPMEAVEQFLQQRGINGGKAAE